ncbi:hypothetical protein BD01_0038 [Thermococcus nautili]|uniref:Uncharacterized protein n=1 Tax=Thermococcus nautili TaxID=195522 RepID=W8NYZ8_9EURY|nr:hypothetical protein BD01_0038 [Thermococcus nautili]
MAIMARKFVTIVEKGEEDVTWVGALKHHWNPTTGGDYGKKCYSRD